MTKAWMLPKSLAKSLHIRPWAGWLILALFGLLGMDSMGMADQMGIRPIFWFTGLLVAAAVYALNELHLLRQAVELKTNEALKAGSLVRETEVERDMIEDALKEFETRLYHLAEASFEAICIHDRGVILDGNGNLSKVFGYAPEVMMGRNILEFVAPECRDLVKENISGSGDAHYEIYGLRQDGQRVHLEIFGKGIPYNGRQVRVAAIRDISGRLKIEEEREYARRMILRGEERRRAVLDSSIDPMIVFDNEDRIVDMNVAVKAILGFEREELIGKSVEDSTLR